MDELMKLGREDLGREHGPAVQETFSVLESPHVITVYGAGLMVRKAHEWLLVESGLSSLEERPRPFSGKPREREKPLRTLLRRAAVSDIAFARLGRPERLDDNTFESRRSRAKRHSAGRARALLPYSGNLEQRLRALVDQTSEDVPNVSLETFAAFVKRVEEASRSGMKLQDAPPGIPWDVIRGALAAMSPEVKERMAEVLWEADRLLGRRP